MSRSRGELELPVLAGPAHSIELSGSGPPLVVVANRLPVERAIEDGRESWASSPGGLVSALAPVVRASAGTWVGWAGGEGVSPEPFAWDGIRCVPVEIDRVELAGFYSGLCNATLWPLYHDVVHQPRYSTEWWRLYVEVNRRFARRAAQVAPAGALVWVHDYHLQLVPALLRGLRPDVAIGFFLHTPFPHRELFWRLPWRGRIVDGLLGADVVGFQTARSAAHFVEAAADRAQPDGAHHLVLVDGRRVRVGAFPISIDVDLFESLAAEPEVIGRSEDVRRRLGKGRKLVLGVDRLDYTKGIDLRLEAFEEWLRRHPDGSRRAVLVQVAVPSREGCSGYGALRARVDGLVGRINGEYGEVGRAAVHYLRRSFSVRELVALYRAADVMLVTPLCDGMNLVAKEYVATRLDDDGALILSEFAGAAAELDGSLLVNPHDIDGMCDALDRALDLGAGEAERRMRVLRRAVRRHTIHDWASGFLSELARAECLEEQPAWKWPLRPEQ